MHPNAFLQTFWRMDLRPKVFVAMSFATQYESRFRDVISPAITRISVNGVALRPYRVDLSKTGDSILTDIVDGIAHSRLILADVSTIGRDAVTGMPYRNANVLYEVGIALACRQPQDVLLVRDDDDKFLFDVSTVPHMRVNFTDATTAREQLHSELMNRLREQSLVHDARVELALTGLTREELIELRAIADRSPQTVWGRPEKGVVDFHAMACMPRLLDKGLVKVAGQFEEGHPAYQATPLGLIVAKLAKSSLRSFRADRAPTMPDEPPKTS